MDTLVACRRRVDEHYLRRETSRGLVGMHGVLHGFRYGVHAMERTCRKDASWEKRYYH